MINIVSIRNRWYDSGLLDGILDIKDQVGVSKMLDKITRILTNDMRDGDLPDGFQNNSNIPFTALIEVFDMIYNRNYIKSEVQLKLLADKLRMEEHKINVEDIVMISYDVYKDNPSEGFISTFAPYDVEIAKAISERYLIKHGI